MLVKRRRKRRPPETPLTVSAILAWADAHHKRRGRWPHAYAGPVIHGPLGMNWRKIDNALRYGHKGLEGKSSLAQLLADKRGVRNKSDLPELTEEIILTWADRHRSGTGNWPNIETGSVIDAPGEDWRSINQALREGLRGLPGGNSLARLIAAGRQVRNLASVRALTVAKILALADVHHRRTGKWPNRSSFAVIGAKGETWSAIESALRVGIRGLPGGSSLPALLAEHRGHRHKGNLPRLTKKQIRAWAKAHFQRTGQWPRNNSGPVVEAPGQTWKAIEVALYQGGRGLPGGLTLAGLLRGD